MARQMLVGQQAVVLELSQPEQQASGKGNLPPPCQ